MTPRRAACLDRHHVLLVPIFSPMSAGLVSLVATQLTDEDDPEDFDAILHFSVKPMGENSSDPLKAAPQ